MVVWTLVVAGIALLAVAVVPARPQLLERWIVWRLESGDEDERKAAAARLWAMGSTAAVPHRIRDLVTERYVGTRKGDEVSVRFEGEKLRLAMPYAIDLQYVGGHGAYLSFVRCWVRPEGIDVEKVVWEGKTIMSSTVSGQVSRAHVTRQDFERVLEAVRVLPTIVLQETEEPLTLTENPDGSYSVSGPRVWGTTNSFFTLVRVLDDSNQTVFERHYAGYEGSFSQERYLALVAVSEIADEILAESSDWQAVPQSEWRRSHFSSAFALNKRVMRGGSYWFVMEDSVEALAWFGTADVLPALRNVRERADTLNRQARKIDAILSRPDRWLQGEPKELEIVADDE